MAEKDTITPNSQPVLQRPAPSRDSAATGRDVLGRYAHGHTQTLKHGRYSAAVRRGKTPEQSELVAALLAKRQQIIADHGTEPSELWLSTLDLYTDVLVVHQYAAEKLKAEGLLTAGGRVRAVFTAFLSTTDRLVRLAQLLGLDRKAHDIGDVTLEGWLARQQGAPGATTARDGNAGDAQDGGSNDASTEAQNKGEQ